MNMLKLSDESKAKLLPFYALLRNLAVVAAVFNLVVGVILLLSYIHFKTYDPIHSPYMPQLISQIQQGGASPEVVESARAYDLMIRRAHFTALAFHQFGAYLLLGGMLVLLVCLKLVYELKRPLPHPGKFQTSEENPRQDRFILAGILAAATLVVVLAFLLPRLFSAPWFIPGQKAAANNVQAPFPTQEQVQSQWPNFRGPGGLGVAAASTPVQTWNMHSGQNVLWKKALVQPGFNSPIIWENRIFLSGADQKARVVYCYDLATGNLLWQRATTSNPKNVLPNVTEDTGWAAPSLATDGRAVAAIFASGEILVTDCNGSVLWEKKLPTPDNPYGHASSLIIYQNLLLVQYDQSKGAKVTAFRLFSGKRAWEQKREVDTTWASPVLVQNKEQMQLILTATPLIIAYAPLSGKILWQMENVIAGEIGPSPAYTEHRLFFMNQFSTLACVDLDQNKVVWNYDRNLSDIPSPVAAQDLLIAPTSGGKITCLDAKTGQPLWNHRFSTGFYASPVVCGDKVYALDKDGVMHIFALAPSFRSIADLPLEEACMATPAFAGDKIVVRGTNTLFCLGSTGP